MTAGHVASRISDGCLAGVSGLRKSDVAGNSLASVRFQCVRFSSLWLERRSG